jgi:UDP-N-acetylglucosamine 2-epimerase (non-hydrolysing)
MANRRIRVLTIFGTRPDAIKMAPVVHELARRSDRFDSRVCITSQHKEMLAQVLDAFEIKPSFDLDVMRPNQDLFDITLGVLSGMKRVLAEANPDVALVHGDTTSCMAASLACFYASVPVGHVEAGLRTQDKRQPYPEEINRRIADGLCDLHFAPTELNRANLLAENLPPDGIVLTGNTVVDALLWSLPKARSMQPAIPGLERIDWSKRTILVTCHRRESFGDQLREICSALRALLDEFPDVNMIYPVHRNPNVVGPVTQMLSATGRMFLIDPLDYLPFVWLMDRAHLVLTDSGGIQEEAPSLDKPVIVMRNKTERDEAIKTGAVVLAGTSAQQIIDTTRRLLMDQQAYLSMARATNPYGDGLAARRIADELERRFGAGC